MPVWIFGYATRSYRSLAHSLFPTYSLQIANRPAKLVWNSTMNETNNFGKQYFGSFNVNHWKNGCPQPPLHTNTFAKVFVSFHFISFCVIESKNTHTFESISFVCISFCNSWRFSRNRWLYFISNFPNENIWNVSVYVWNM